MSRYVNPVPQYYLNDGSVASSGKLYFYENKDPNTKKDTFSDIGESIKNTNPVLLDGEGRCPPIFGTGRYTVVLKSNQNIQQWSRDDVELTSVLGQFADWSAIITYRVNDIVRGSDGNYYASLISNNLGNDPLTNPSLWEELAFLTFWNSSITYAEGDLVIHEGTIWRSAVNSNNSEPGTDQNWENALSSGQRVILSGGSTTINSGFNDTYIWNDTGGHILTIGVADGDEGSTETIIICDPNSPSNITITQALGVTLNWSFSDIPGIVDGYEIKPGETLRLVTTDNKDTHVVYADNGISEVVELGGEFDASQNARISRIGNIVTIATIGTVTHPSDNTANSAAVVPALFRPENSLSNLYQTAASRVSKITITTSGTVQTNYIDWAGASANFTDTGGVASITYDVKNS